MLKHINWIKIIILVAFLYLLSLVTAVYFPVIIAVILSFILNPLVNIFCRIKISPLNLVMPRGFAVLLAFLFTCLMVMIIAKFVFMPFIREFDKFAANLPVLIQKIQQITIEIQARAHQVTFPENVSSIVQQAVSSAASFSVGLVRKLVNSIFDLASRIIELVVVPVLTYYFIKDWQVLKNSFISIFPKERKSQVQTIIAEMAAVISGYIRGQFCISIAVGLTVFCGMYLLGVDYPLVLGLLATLTETIPIIGPIIGAVPAILLAFLSSPTLAIKVVLFFIIVHQIENHLIVPNIMGHTIDLHPATVIIVLLIGGQLYGIIGMMLAVPVTALLKVMVRHLWFDCSQ